MRQGRGKRVIVPGVSIWPQPKQNPRQAYRISWGSGAARKTIVASTSLERTVEMAVDIANRHERIRLGLTRADAERFVEHDRKPIINHLNEYRESLVASGAVAKHARQMYLCAKAVLLGTEPKPTDKRRRGRPAVELAGIGVDRISEIAPSLVQGQIGKVKAARSAATANRYLDAVNCFLNWGVADQRWERNVIAHLRGFNVEADRKRVRRVIPIDQVAKMIQATEVGPVRERVEGRERAMIYRTCIATGLRAEESRRLKVEDVVLADEPGIWTDVKVAKNRRRRFIPIPAALALMLKPFVEGRASQDAVFHVPQNTARMLRADLYAVGIPYELHGQVFDFHGLRHLCGAILISAGANVKAVELHMRHSTSKLTLDTYGHLLEKDQRALVKAVLSSAGSHSYRTELRLSCAPTSVRVNQSRPVSKLKE